VKPRKQPNNAMTWCPHAARPRRSRTMKSSSEALSPLAELYEVLITIRPSRPKSRIVHSVAVRVPGHPARDIRCARNRCRTPGNCLRRSARSGRPGAQRTGPVPFTCLTVATEPYAARLRGRVRLRWASKTIATIRASIVSVPTFSARYDERARRVDRPIAGAFAAGIDSPVTIDSSTALEPSTTTPSTGTPCHPAARAADRDRIERNLFVLTAHRDTPRRLRSKIEQRSDCAAGLLACSHFKHLAQLHEDRDGGSGLQVHRRRAVHVGKTRGEDLRCKSRDHAVKLGAAGAERDQAKHIQTAVCNRCPSALSTLRQSEPRRWIMGSPSTCSRTRKVRQLQKLPHKWSASVGRVKDVARSVRGSLRSAFGRP
jgi:hypothetical protein